MSKTNLSEFINHIKKNSIARSNRFRVTFSLPYALSGGKGIKGVETSQKIMSLTCLMVDIPGKQEKTSTINYGNYDRKVVHGRTTNDITTTFLLTGNYAEKKIFESWHDIICDESQNAVQFYDDYICGVMVECLNEQDQVVYDFELLEAYPISIGNLKLDRTAQNQQMALDIGWAYHRVVFGPDQKSLSAPAEDSFNPLAAIPGADAGKQRLFPIPELDGLSNGVKNAVDTIKGFDSQLKGVLAIANDVREQVRDFKMAAIDGVKVLNGVVKDVKSIANIPTDVKNEVVKVVVDTRNQIGYLKNEVKDFSDYPKR
jgi:hypothetical protein